ncbi:MAG: AAA-like domain-containing protein [Lachnospiraceae bacterium]|nr:AAA-like domain-containing protein [Lachnospiraceae bacterium]
MARYFNTEGACMQDKHYMVRLDHRLKKIKEDYVDAGSYFVINKGRQYGKTTTLQALAKYLSDAYIVLSLDFQLLGTEDFTDEMTFSRSLVEYISRKLKKIDGGTVDLQSPVLNNIDYGLKELFVALSNMCESSPRPMVLIIDEVDSAGNNQVFIDFLAQLRGYYLEREETSIFHSVVLAGVYDIKNLKLKFRSETEHQYNSPWNIAAKFDIDMDFSVNQIAAMLGEYEDDYHTGMNTQTVAEEIYAYISGYPVLVSSICKCIDEKLLGESSFEEGSAVWSVDGVAEAVKNILKESTPLFESMVKQLDIYKDLNDMIEDILYQGRRIPFEIDVKPINMGKMFGFLKEVNGQVAIANRIFEMKLLNTFITKEALKSESYRSAQRDMNQFVEDGRLNMTLLLEKFVTHFHDVYDMRDERFIEDNGRKFFLLYLKSVINGTGNYYIEAQTRDARRTDVIVDYCGEQFIVELKIWHGSEYNERGERQLTDYLEYYHKDKGYLLSFNFNQKKETGVKEIQIGGKTIVEAVV